jgi:ubiquinone/menaquinone biosynthesis C-methylase UbiE
MRTKEPMKLSFGLLALVAALGCGRTTPSAPAQAPPQPTPLVHRFEHAEQWAKEFDDPARDAWQKPAEVVAAMHASVGMTVADVGAGTGYFEPYLSRTVGPTGTVLAVDIEPDMVRYLRERAAREHIDNLRAVLADVADPKLPAHGVDRVLIVDTWHHIPAHAGYLAKLRGALSPDGTITIVEFTLDSPHGPPREHRIPPETLIAELQGAGMKAELADLSLPYQYVVVAR